jgi:hypothetical protein
VVKFERRRNRRQVSIYPVAAEPAEAEAEA